MKRYKQSDSLAPLKLLKQIVLLQCIYYGIGIILFIFTYLVMGIDVHFLQIFSWKAVTFNTSIGLTLAMIWLLDTFFTVLAMVIVVGRSKLALDFTLTLHGINIVVAWAADQEFPTSPLWWAVQAASVVLMVTLGTWASQWRELRVTFFEGNDDYELVRVPRKQPAKPEESTEPLVEGEGEERAAAS